MSFARKSESDVVSSNPVRKSPAKDVRGVDRVVVGAEELRKFFKHYLDGDALVVVGSSWRTRALLIPWKCEVRWDEKAGRALIRRMKAFVLAELKRLEDND
jgi:hypothetical protein